MCVVLLLSSWGASISTPFVANVHFPIIYVVDAYLIISLRQRSVRNMFFLLKWSREDGIMVAMEALTASKKHWPIQAQRERGHKLYNKPRRSFLTPEVPLVLKRLNNTEWVAHRTEDVVCAYSREVPFMLTLAWAQMLYKQQCAFPVQKKHHYILAAMQGAIGSKADIKS